MKTIALGLLFGAALLPAATLRADEAAAGRGGAGELVVVAVQDLNLTDEQTSKIAEIRKEYRPKIAEARNELSSVVQEEMNKVRGILTPDQRTKLQNMRMERKENRGEGLAQ